MGLLLILLGVITLIASLVCSIIAIINGTPKTIALVLLIVGGSLIKIGREIDKKNKRP